MGLQVLDQPCGDLYLIPWLSVKAQCNFVERDCAVAVTRYLTIVTFARCSVLSGIVLLLSSRFRNRCV